MSKDAQVKTAVAENKPSGSNQVSKPNRRRPRRLSSADNNEQRKRVYQAKLLVEEDSEAQTCLVKITRQTGIRQVINYVLPKLRDEWNVELNGFSMDISKVLHSTEILKTRIPFLYQETKFISQAKDIQIKGEENEVMEKVFTGLSVILSKNQFEVSDQAGF
jgi:hypothetical protein